MVLVKKVGHLVEYRVLVGMGENRNRTDGGGGEE